MYIYIYIFPFHSIPVAIPPRWWRWRRAHICIGQFLSPRNCLHRNVQPLNPSRSKEAFMVLVGVVEEGLAFVQEVVQGEIVVEEVVESVISVPE